MDERITSALAEAASPLPFGELRSKCRVRAATLYERLAALTTSGRIARPENVAIASLADNPGSRLTMRQH